MTTERRADAHEFANTAYDNVERELRTKWPNTYKGQTKKGLAELNEDRRLWLANPPTIITPQMADFHKRLDRQVGKNSQKWYGIEGVPYIGKSHILKSYVDQFHVDHTEQRPFVSGTEWQPIPVVWLQTPSTFKALMKRFLAFYLADDQQSGTGPDMVQPVARLVKKHQTKLIVLDDLHTLPNEKGGIGNHLKHFRDVCGEAIFLYTATQKERRKHGGKPEPAAAALRDETGGAQINARATVLRLDPHSLDNDWLRLLQQFEKAMPWCYDRRKPQLHQHASQIHELTGGRCGLLAELLSETTSLLIEANSKSEDRVTEELLNEAGNEIADAARIAA